MDVEHNLTDRQTEVDVFKGICILMIIVTHFSWSKEERLRYLFPFWIDMAVPLLMIISGYVYALSYRNHKIHSFEDAYALKNTAGKIIRYTMPFAITYIVEEIIVYRMNGEWTTIYGILAAFLNGGRGSGGYYYPVMLQFIFIYPFIYFIVQRYRWRGVLTCGLFNGIYELLKWSYGMNESCYRFLIFRYILVIAWGCYLSFELLQMDRKKCIVTGFAGFVFILLVKYLNYSPPMLAYWTGTSFLACLYMIPISAFLFKRLHIRCSWLEVIGKASFNIFLIQKLYYFCMEYGYGHIFDHNPALQLLANIIICTVTGILFYYMEMPLTKKIVKWVGA